MRYLFVVLPVLALALPVFSEGTKPPHTPVHPPATQPSTQPALPSKQEVVQAIKDGRLLVGMDLAQARVAMKSSGTESKADNGTLLTITWVRSEKRKGVVAPDAPKGTKPGTDNWEITTVATINTLRVTAFNTQEKLVNTTKVPWPSNK
ncbi:MAG: hypothetical protein WCJ97_06320 [Phycisphaerae bacterium]